MSKQLLMQRRVPSRRVTNKCGIRNTRRTSWKTNFLKYDAIGKTIELQIDASTLAAAAKYIEALSVLGWALEEGGIRDEECTLMTFKKDNKEISLRARPQDGNALVSFSGDDLLWTKALPGGKQLIPYETWLRLNKRQPGLDALDQYEAEMRALLAP